MNAERLWSTNRTEQLQMQRLYLAALQAKKLPLSEQWTHLYAAMLETVRIGGGGVLPAFKAQLVFEAAAQE